MLLLCVWLLGFSLSSMTLQASGRFMSGSSIAMEHNSPVRMSIDFPFDGGPAYGHVPFIVSIHNMSGSDAVWSVDVEIANDHYRNKKTTKSSFRLEVPEGQKQQFYLSAPAFQSESLQNSHSQTNFIASFSGPFIRPHSQHYQRLTERTRNARSPNMVLMSPSLRNQHGRNLQNLYQARSLNHFVSSYKKEILPEDWRCYAGFSMLLVAQNDWLGLPKNVRDSIFAAVATGEVQLRFIMKDEEVTSELAQQMGIPQEASVWAHGFGVMARYPDTLNELLMTTVKSKKGPLPEVFDPKLPMVKQTEAESVVRNSNTNKDIRALGQTIYKEPLSGNMISLFVVAFALFVGPINIFIFAKGRKRLRLFITTPLISLGASLLMFMGILFVDGLGGEGFISRVIFLEPDSDEAYVMQEQFSKTGLFFSKPFEVEGEELLHFRGSRLSSFGQSTDAGSFKYASGMHAGDWFKSKRIQSHALKTYLSSRESIELIQRSGQPYELFSNFRAICDLVYYVDTDGSVWQAKDLRLGGRAKLEPADKVKFEEWYVGQCYASGVSMGNELALFGIRKGHYYAQVRDWQQAGLETSDRIKWQMHSQILIGQPKASGKGGK